MVQKKTHFQQSGSRLSTKPSVVGWASDTCSGTAGNGKLKQHPFPNQAANHNQLACVIIYSVITDLGCQVGVLERGKEQGV
jgi:hypothetical protein